jgi:hypothetical protein
MRIYQNQESARPSFSFRAYYNYCISFFESSIFSLIQCFCILRSCLIHPKQMINLIQKVHCAKSSPAREIKDSEGLRLQNRAYKEPWHGGGRRSESWLFGANSNSFFSCSSAHYFFLSCGSLEEVLSFACSLEGLSFRSSSFFSPDVGSNGPPTPGITRGFLSKIAIHLQAWGYITPPAEKRS